MSIAQCRPLWPVLAASAVLASGCVSKTKTELQTRVGESVVLIADQPAALAQPPERGRPLQVRSTYQPQTDSILFVEGSDFVVNWPEGALQRTPGSRLPDFRTNMLYGQEGFDHSKFPGFGNSAWFAFVDYSFAPSGPWPAQAAQVHLLPLTQAKLREGKPVKIVAFGDSITAGGDASKPELIFWRRWADALQQTYPAAKIVAINGATGGDSTVQGLQRLEAKVLNEKPDLVLIGFGMNDHNVGGVPIPQFKANLGQMIDRIRNETVAEVLLFSAFPPNPKWKFGSHRMRDYAEATREVAAEKACAYADVYSNWQSLTARKKPEDVLGNNINHPNDFGHWIYFCVLDALGL